MWSVVNQPGRSWYDMRPSSLVPLQDATMRYSCTKQHKTRTWCTRSSVRRTLRPSEPLWRTTHTLRRPPVKQTTHYHSISMTTIWQQLTPNVDTFCCFWQQKQQVWHFWFLSAKYCNNNGFIFLFISGTYLFETKRQQRETESAETATYFAFITSSIHYSSNISR